MIMSYPRNAFIEQARKRNHSMTFIQECLGYISKLEANGLPVIFDFCHLARFLGMDVKELNEFLQNKNFFYAYFTIKKRSGGKRRIMSPYNNLRDCQLMIKKMILDKMCCQPMATAFVANKSIFDNAKLHEGAKYIKKFDVKNFFESISLQQVLHVFLKAGYAYSVAKTLARICTTQIESYKLEKLSEKASDDVALFEELSGKEAFLVQGAPTSPSLSNLVCYRLDMRLQGVANKYGCTYSRYADDITFSSNDKQALPKTEVIKNILKSEGFELNVNKTKTLHNGQRMEVTGLLINDKVHVKSKYKRDIFRHLRFCMKFGGKTHFARVAPGLQYGKEWLHGRILFVNSVEPKVAKEMMLLFHQIDWMK